MNKLTKFMKAALATALVLALLPGCSDGDGDGADTTTAGTTAAATTAESTTIQTVVQTEPAVNEDDIKDKYALSEDEAAAITDENAPATFKYAGFNSMVFTTPVIGDNVPLMTITPIYSLNGLHSYIHEAEASFDLGSGNGTFSAVAGTYDEEFFNEKALLIISFLDKEGGSAHSVSGAWDDLITGEGFEMDRLVIGLKRAEGDVTAGHVIIEIDSVFLSIWDTYGMELYR